MKPLFPSLLVERETNFDPFDLHAARIFKIRGSRIHDIEALGFTMPYPWNGGWSDFSK